MTSSLRPHGIPAKYRNRAVLSPAEVVDVSPFALRTVQHLISTGEMPSKLERGRRLIPAEWVWQWLGIQGESVDESDGDPGFAQVLSEIRGEIR